MLFIHVSVLALSIVLFNIIGKTYEGQIIFSLCYDLYAVLWLIKLKSELIADSYWSLLKKQQDQVV